MIVLLFDLIITTTFSTFEIISSRRDPSPHFITSLSLALPLSLAFFNPLPLAPPCPLALPPSKSSRPSHQDF